MEKKTKTTRIPHEKESVKLILFEYNMASYTGYPQNLQTWKLVHV